MRILLSLFTLLMSLSISAQSQGLHPMLVEGKSWVYDYHHFEEHEDEPTTETVYPARYTILGDTLIDNKSYYKMYREVDNKNTYYAAYREDGLKVFARFPLINEDIIVADFEYSGLYDPDGYGDNVSYSAVEEYVDYIEINGIKYRRHTYYEDNKENKLVIGVEGIGYTKYGLQYPSIYGPEPDCLCDYKVFTSCEMNGECIFTNEDFYKEAVAQEHEYIPFLAEGKVWKYSYHAMNGNTYNKYLTVKGDTQIDTKSYKKIVDEETGSYECAMREEGSKVYCSQNGNEFLVYDFGLNVGDTFETSNVNATVVAVKDILVGGRSFRVLDVRDNDTNISNWWVEGIGGMNYLTNSIRVPGDNYTFLQCQLGEEVLFSQQDFLTLPDLFAQEYFPEGTKWTEIRLDTLKYDSWYSKVGEEWVPNFETVEYRVQGEYTDMDWVYRKVFTNGPTWTDSLALMILEKDNRVLVSVPTHNYLEEFYVPFPGTAYQFDWSVGKGLYYEDILESNTTSEYPYHCYYGIIDEIKEGIFGGVCSLKYVDLNGKAPVNPQEPGNTDTEGGRIIQGIGITEWKSGECLFGPPNPYGALSMFDYGRQNLYPERHYRSMLVHFERNGEVLYDVWPKKEIVYRPFVEDNKEWTMVYMTTRPPEEDQQTFHYKQIKLGSEIEVDGMTFKQIVCSNWENGQNGPEDWKETEEYLGEADGKVYLYNQQSKNTVQIMDFTLQVGDTYRQTTTGDPNNGYMDFVVTAVTDTLIATSSDKTLRRCLYLSRPGLTTVDDVWIEGIGSLVGGVYGSLVQLMAGAIPSLRKCQKGEQTLYEAYHPFLKEGKTWNCQEYYNSIWDNERWTKNVSYVINGTTEIDGKTYYKLYRVSEESNKYYCALREEDRKVWQYTSYNGDHLLYDFGMSIGDSYKPSNELYYYYQLAAIEPMQFHNNQLLNVFTYDIFLQYDPTNPALYFESTPIVEGVGCLEGWNITTLYAAQASNGIVHGENFLSCYEDGKCIFTADDFNKLANPEPDIAYRPFVEEGKVWKIGRSDSGNPVQLVEYYYFDGDTIIDGKTCKQMMCQRYVSPAHPDYENLSQQPSLGYEKAYYEEDQKVYVYDEISQSMILMYDFSLDAYETLNLLHGTYIIGPRQTGGLAGFKGVYRDLMRCTGEGEKVHSTFWMEGVGGIDGPTINEDVDHSHFLMSCSVGDEVIYLNDEYEDGATPEAMEAPKSRFDFTHTIKIQPKTPKRSEEEESLYGEYNNLRLGIRLDPLNDAYQVTITNESGQVVYEKSINAGNIVGLDIDISTYAKGRYTVTVENSNELFTGEFDALETGIKEISNNKEVKENYIYNLQGQRLNSLQKGINIVNGRKVYY